MSERRVRISTQEGLSKNEPKRMDPEIASSCAEEGWELYLRLRKEMQLDVSGRGPSIMSRQCDI